MKTSASARVRNPLQPFPAKKFPTRVPLRQVLPDPAEAYTGELALADALRALPVAKLNSCCGLLALPRRSRRGVPRTATQRRGYNFNGFRS